MRKEHYECGFCGTKMKYIGYKKRKRTIDHYYRCPKCKAEKCVIEVYNDSVVNSMLDHVLDKTF